MGTEANEMRERVCVHVCVHVSESVCACNKVMNHKVINWHLAHP